MPEDMSPAKIEAAIRRRFPRAGGDFVKKLLAFLIDKAPFLIKLILGGGVFSATADGAPEANLEAVQSYLDSAAFALEAPAPDPGVVAGPMVEMLLTRAWESILALAEEHDDRVIAMLSAWLDRVSPVRLP